MFNTIKKAVAVLIAIILCISLQPAVFADGETSGECGDGLTWSYSSGVLSISGSGAMWDYTGLAPAPWKELAGSIQQIVFGRGVSSVGSFAFADANGVKLLYLPEGLTTIGASAFKGCSGLKEIVFPSTLTNIGEKAFFGLTRIETVSYPGTEGGISIGADNSALEQGEWYYVSSQSALVYVNAASFSHGSLIPRKIYAVKGENIYFDVSVDTGWSVSTITADHGIVNLLEGYVTLASDGDYSSLSFTVTVEEMSPEAQLRRWAADPNETCSFEVDDDLTLTDSFTLPEGKSLIINAKLTAAEGKRFIQSDSIIVSAGAELVIPATAEYSCNAGLTVYGSLTLEGSLALGSDAYMDLYDGALRFSTDSVFSFPGGTTPLKVKDPAVSLTGVPAEAVLLEKELTSDNDAAACIAFAGAGFSGKARVNVVKGMTITLSENCTIPEGFELYCAGTLTVEAGTTVENRGSILMDGSFSEASGYGTLIIEDGACLNNSGTVKVRDDELEGEENIVNSGTLQIIPSTVTVGTEAELRAAMEYVPVEITLSTHLDVFSDITIPAGAAVTVPSNYSLHVAAGKKLTISGTLMNNGAVYAFGGIQGSVTGNTPVQQPEGVLDMGSCGKTLNDLVSWQLTSEGCLNLTGSGEMRDCSAVPAPWMESGTEIRTIVVNGPAFVGTGVMESAVNCTELRFAGDAPTFASEVSSAVKCFYPCKRSGWDDAGRAAIAPDSSWELWHPNAVYSRTEPTPDGETDEADIYTCPDCQEEYKVPVKATVAIPDYAQAGLTEGQTVYVDGKPRTLGSNGTVELPKGGASSITAYTYNADDPDDVHKQYPTGMKVWLLTDNNGNRSAERAAELDDILQYAGSSIRITGVKGIRMITGIDASKKTALIGAGLAGCTLEEYGTLLCFRSEMVDGSLVLTDTYARSNYAYKKGVADPVFARSGSQVQYTNVLVGFSDVQCSDDIAMRSYITLKDADGNRFTVYGGIVYRSIGYIAYQNRSVFAPGTEAYSYIWHIIHTVYGDQYDADYRG